MFREFLFPLVRFFTPFNIFQYITFRAAYAAITSLLLSFIFGPAIIRMLRRLKFGEEIRSDGPETHLVKKGTPTMGGVMIVFSVLISSLLWMNVRTIYTWLCLAALVSFGLLGFLDDYLKITRKEKGGLVAGVKFVGQTVIAITLTVILYLFGGEFTSLLYVPFIKEPILDMGIWYIPFAIILLVATTNAVNLTDGLDGLATGLVIMAGITFTILSYLAGRVDFAEYLAIPYLPVAGELAVFTLALVGAAVGFLWFNSHPAEVMMGDTGALALGGGLGMIALIIKKEILLIVIGGVFVLEVVSVIIQVVSFKLRKKRVFLMAPLHHHFELMGWPESKVVIRFWILGGLFAILSLSTLKIR